MVQLTYGNQSWRCEREHLLNTSVVLVLFGYSKGARKVSGKHFLNTSVVLVLFGYSKGARKVSGKCIKGTPSVLRRCLQDTRLSITCVIIFHGLPPVDKRNFWLTSLDRPCPVLS